MACRYLDYEDALLKCGYADFSHLLLWADDVLSDARIADDYGMGMRHIMVDEYQDVSRLMELILLRLAEYHGNAAVVGDLNQSIYRFRGVGPEAMLGFNEHFPDCRVVTLDTNYRSHPGILRACNRLIAHNQRHDGDARALGAAYVMFPYAPDTRADYPAAVTVFGWDVGDEMAELIDVVKFLHSHDIVSDYSDIALLLHSVKQRVSGSYVKAFHSRRNTRAPQQLLRWQSLRHLTDPRHVLGSAFPKARYASRRCTPAKAWSGPWS